MGFSIKLINIAERTLAKGRAIVGLEKIGAESKLVENAAGKINSAFTSNPVAAEKLSQQARELQIPITQNIIPKTINTNPGCIASPEMFKIRYSAFTRNLESEITPQVNTLIKAANKTVNRIQSKDIGQIKSELHTAVNELEPRIQVLLRKQIDDCKNPDEILKVAKDVFTRHEDSFNNEASELLEAVKSKAMPLETGEKILADIKNSNYDILKKIYAVSNPKSTNAEVIKIEQEVKKLGVKDVNFSDDLERAQIVLDAVKQMAKGKVPLPESITVSQFLPGGALGESLDKNIYLQTSKQAKVNYQITNLITNSIAYRFAPNELKQKYMADYLGFASTKNPAHCVFHETGHTFQLNNLKEHLVELSEAEMQTANGISKYASSLETGLEAMPEIFAKLMDGQKITDAEMALHLKLGGKIPQL